MTTFISRRDFVQYAGFAVAAGLQTVETKGSVVSASERPQKFLAGFAPATAGTVDSYWKVCDGCADTGFRNLEVDNTRLLIAEEYVNRVSEFRDEMSKRDLRLVGLNQAFSFVDPTKRDEIGKKTELLGKFLKGIGGIYLGWQGSLSESEEESRHIAQVADFEGKRLWEENGIRLTYHPHSTSGVGRMLDLTKPEFVYFNPDLGWLGYRGGADALEICKAYRSRLACIHFKDFDPNVEYEVRGTPRKGGIVTIGKGVIDFPAVVDFLKESEFDGCVLGEHSGARTPESKDIYQEYKTYMAEKLRLQL
jgi:sugar phosphate isomerase/epimerase